LCFFGNFCFIRFVNNCVCSRAKASVHLWASTVLQFVGDCHWVHHHCDNKHGVRSLLSLSLSLNWWSALQVVVCKFHCSLVVSGVIIFHKYCKQWCPLRVAGFPRANLWVFKKNS
jgi:hypothetical protein